MKRNLEIKYQNKMVRISGSKYYFTKEEFYILKNQFENDMMLVLDNQKQIDENIKQMILAYSTKMEIYQKLHMSSFKFDQYLIENFGTRDLQKVKELI